MRIALIAMLSGLALSGQQTGSIIGAAIDPAGGLIIQVRVVAIGADKSSFEAKTDPLTNTFTILNLPPGNYIVRIESPGFEGVSIKAEVRPGETTRLPKVTLEIATIKHGLNGPPEMVVPRVAFNQGEQRVEGAVSDFPSGVGLEHAIITIRNLRTGRTAAKSQTGIGGRFSTTALPPGRYSLTAHATGYADFIIDSIEIRPGNTSRIVEPLAVPRCSPGHKCAPRRKTASIRLML